MTIHAFCPLSVQSALPLPVTHYFIYVLSVLAVLSIHPFLSVRHPHSVRRIQYDSQFEPFYRIDNKSQVDKQDSSIPNLRTAAEWRAW